jgi:hypothetical protein
MLTFLEIPYIEADAADVSEIMRSPEPVILAKGDVTFSVLSYIGVIKRENWQLTYLALHVREINSSLIYAIENGESTAEMARREGENFLNGIGFRLEPVSLGFGPAMREVILRDIPVILPSEMVKRIYQEKKNQLAEWRRLIEEPDRGKLVESNASAVAKKIAAEILIAEGMIAKKFAAFRQIVEGYLQQVNAVKVAAAERFERERLQAILATAQAATAEMKTKIGRLEEELATVKTERDVLAEAKRVADVLLAEGRQQRAQAEPARESAKKDAENPLAGIDEELRLAQAFIDRFETGHNGNTPALATAERRSEEKSSPIELPVSAAEELIDPLPIESPQAAKREEVLRQEVERHSTPKAAEKRLPEMEPAGRTAAAMPIGKVAAAEPEKQIPSEPLPHIVRRPPAADAFFQVNWDLTGVPYRSPEEVCEIRKSLNRIRLRLEGYPEQYCSVCLIIVKSGERKNVFIAFGLSVTKRVLVYVPIKPTDTPSAFANVLKEAEKFIMVLGLDLEIVPLSQDLQQRAKTLESISLVIRQ